MKKPFLARNVHGYSMMPILPPGTSVLAIRWFRQLREGNVVIFLHQGKEKIKRIRDITKSGQLFVVGEHESSSTDSRQFGPIERAAVIGKVIWPSVKPRG